MFVGLCVLVKLLQNYEHAGTQIKCSCMREESSCQKQTVNTDTVTIAEALD